MFTRLHRDVRWRSSRKALARAFSADETRCGCAWAQAACPGHPLLASGLAAEDLLKSLVQLPVPCQRAARAGGVTCVLGMHGQSVWRARWTWLLTASRHGVQEQIWCHTGGNPEACHKAGLQARRRRGGGAGRHAPSHTGAAAVSTAESVLQGLPCMSGPPVVISNHGSAYVAKNLMGHDHATSVRQR